MKLLVSLLATTWFVYAGDSGYLVAMYTSKERPGLSRPFAFKVEGKTVAKVRFPTYFRLEVPPGAYSITTDSEADAPILCHVIAGESCYVRGRQAGSSVRPQVQLLSPMQAAVELQKLIPLEKEHILIERWK